jgi:hypothetical protein
MAGLQSDPTNAPGAAGIPRFFVIVPRLGCGPPFTTTVLATSGGIWRDTRPPEAFVNGFQVLLGARLVGEGIGRRVGMTKSSRPASIWW